MRTTTDSTVRLTLGGELDIATVPRLDDALRDLDALVVLDLRALQFMDCSAGRLILTADRRIRQAGGRLVVLRGSAFVDWFCSRVGIDRLLEFVDHPPPHDESARANSGTPEILREVLSAPRAVTSLSGRPD